MKDNKLKYVLVMLMALSMGLVLISCGSSGGSKSSSATEPATEPATEVAVKGSAYAIDEDNFRADLSLDVNSASLSTSWLEFSYQNSFLVSTSITEVSESGGDVIVWTIRGIGTLKNQEGYTFTATVTDSDPQEIAIEILDPNGVEYLTISSLKIVTPYN